LRILVFVNPLVLGGSSINAIDLAAAARDHGHEVALFAVPGPAAELARRRGIEFIAAPTLKRPFPRPSWPMMRALDGAVRRICPDVLHVWEMPQIYDAYYGVHVRRGLPILATNMTMGHMRTIPPEIPLTAGTPEIVDATRRERRGPVWLLEPPVDTAADDPARVDPDPFLAVHDIPRDGTPLVIVVSRLAAIMKLEGIRDAIRAVELLDPRRSVRLLIAGSGDAYGDVDEHAEAVNARLNRRAVILAGPLDDPRPAYAAADLVLGMGSSALRGLAFGKPTIVLGVHGFSEIFAPSTRDRFLHGGYYGVGPAQAGREPVEAAARRLADQIEHVIRDPDAPAFGAASRSLVLERYSVPVISARLDAIYREVASPVARRRAVLEAIRHTPTTVLTQLPPRIKSNAGLRWCGRRIGFLGDATA
jgi:L-malate glycosyltransferase